MNKRIIATVLLGTFVFVACVFNVAPNSGQSSENEVKNEEIVTGNVTENKRGISSVIEDSLENENISSKQKNAEEKVKESLTEAQENEPKIQKDGWTTTSLNIREQPNTDSNILDVLPFNAHVQYYEYDDEWAEIAFDNGQAYVSLDYVSDEECDFVMYSVPKTKGFKSYMSYKAITSKSSKQYKLQQIASTGAYGIRTYDNRYLVAIGTAFNADIGTYVDLILEDGFVIPCIVGDVKDNKHTDSTNMITKSNNCVSEFIIDPRALYKPVKQSGDVSSCNESWEGCVKAVVVYDKSVL